MTATQIRRRLGVAAIVLALAALPIAADFETGISYYKSGKYLEAAGQFQALVDENPDYADGYHLLGICFLKTKKYADAEKNFLKAIELNGDKFEFHFNLANAYAAQKKHDKVVKTLNNAEGLAADNQRSMIYQTRGHALAAQKKWGEAVDDLERAVAAKPDPGTQAQLGKAYFSVGEYQSAVTVLRKSLASKQNASSYQLLVEAMINLAAKTSGESAKKSKYAEALTQAEKFLAFQPAFEARYLVGRTALGAGQFDKAIGAFRDVIKEKPNHCNAVANLGKAYTAKGDWTNAVSSLDGATKCDPKMGLAWENMGFALQKTASGAKDFAVKQRSYEKAIAAYQKAKAIKPSASIDKAISDCEQNMQINVENRKADSAEADQDAAIKAEEQRVKAEEAKVKEWEAKQDKDD
jgi:tetratricopeptide (TPR) repeat protein